MFLDDGIELTKFNGRWVLDVYPERDDDTGQLYERQIYVDRLIDRIRLFAPELLKEES